MTHLDDGTLLTFLDDELGADRHDALASHVNGCGACAERLRELEAERSLLAVTLPALDVTPAPAAAKKAVLARLRDGESGTDQSVADSGAASRRAGRGDGEPVAAPGAQDRPGASERVAQVPRVTEAPGRRAHGWARPALARAAGLLLVFAAAAAAAIPGSPLRSWLVEVIGPSEVESPAPEPTAEPTEDVVSGPEGNPQEVGIQMDPGGGELVVSLSGLPPGAEVQVRLVGGIRSWVYAAEGARFQTRPGAVDAEVPGEYVRVELARSLALASVEVDGVLYLRKTGDRLELAGPRRDSTDAEIRFEVP
jgi:anti-sigma factor RsiW